MEPKFRFALKKVLDELADEMNLRERISEWDSVAGYSYTPGNPEDIDEYIEKYYSTTDEDRKFVLMEMLIQANIEEPEKSKFISNWMKIEPLLLDDFKIHEYTIYYWKDMTFENFENCKLLSPLLQDIWEDKNSNEL